MPLLFSFVLCALSTTAFSEVMPLLAFAREGLGLGVVHVGLIQSIASSVAAPTRLPSHQADSTDGLRNRAAGVRSVCLSEYPRSGRLVRPRWYLLVIPTTCAALAAEVMMGALHRMLAKAAPGDVAASALGAGRAVALAGRRGPRRGGEPLRGDRRSAGGAAPLPLREGRLAFAFCAIVSRWSTRGSRLRCRRGPRRGGGPGGGRGKCVVFCGSFFGELSCGRELVLFCGFGICEQFGFGFGGCHSVLGTLLYAPWGWMR